MRSTLRISAAIAIVVMMVAVGSATAQTPDNENSVAFWCGTDGEKFEPVTDPFVVPEPAAGHTWTLLVLKAASGDDQNFEVVNPIPGVGYSHPSKHANSHAILCWQGEPSSTTTQPSPTTSNAGGPTTLLEPTTTSIGSSTTTLPEPSTTTTDPKVTTTSSSVPKIVTTTTDPSSSTPSTTVPVDETTTTTVPESTTTTIPEVVTDIPDGSGPNG